MKYTQRVIVIKLYNLDLFKTFSYQLDFLSQDLLQIIDFYFYINDLKKIYANLFTKKPILNKNKTISIFAIIVKV